MTYTAPSVGLLYPGIGAADDFPALETRLDGAIRLPLVNTAGGDVAHTVDSLIGVGRSENLLEGARQVLDHSPDSVMWACTSGSFVYGWEGSHRQAADIADATGKPASSTSIAFAAAVAHLGLTKVSIAASYPEDLARHFRMFLADAGIDVVHMGSNDIATAGEVGRMGRDDIIDMARSADHPHAEAILIPDTAMHSLAWIDEFEAALDKPVLTANQATIWEGLRIAGNSRPLPGLGFLFSDRNFIKAPASSRARGAQ